MQSLNYLWRVGAAALSYSVFAVGAILMTFIVVVGIGPLPVEIHKKRNWVRRLIMVAAWLYIRMMRMLGLLTFDLNSIKGLHRPGSLIIANHLTLIDALFLMSVSARTCFIVKAALADNPITSGLIQLAGYIPNCEHGTQLLDHAVDVLQNNESLVVFPEGTRSAQPGSFKFKRGAANIALITNCVIQPIYIECEPLALRKGEKWYHLPERPSHYKFSTLPLVHVDAHIDLSQPVSLQARVLTRHLQSLYNCAMQHSP